MTSYVRLRVPPGCSGCAARVAAVPPAAAHFAGWASTTFELSLTLLYTLLYPTRVQYSHQRCGIDARLRALRYMSYHPY